MRVQDAHPFPMAIHGGNSPGEIGIDEAGRGCLAGPVVAGAVFFPAGVDCETLLPGLGDSKKLTVARRDALAPIIRQCSVWGVGFAWPDEIDRHNILRATFLAMTRATLALARRGRVAANTPGLWSETLNTALCIDGNRIIPTEIWKACSPLPVPRQRAVVGGDGLIDVISAASVLAKTARDLWMSRLDRRFPGYGFARHKGYGTGEHIAALQKLGPCPLHRKTFRKVRPEETQGSLF